MSIKEQAKQERKKFREIQGFSKKAGYIWDYYRYLIFGIIIAAAFAVSIGNTIYRNIKYTQIFYCAIFNNYMTDDMLTGLQDGFEAYYELDPESETMYFDSSYMLSEKEEDFEAAYATVQKIGAMVAAKTVDVMMGDEYTLAQYAEQSYFYNLEEILPPDVLDAVSGYLLYYTGEEGLNLPYALDISSSRLVQDKIIYTTDPVLGIVVNSKHPEVAVEFIRYAFGL